MALVHVSGNDHVNPVDVVRVKGFFNCLRIDVFLRDGTRLERFVSERIIEYRTQPSGSTQETWSEQQRDFFARIWSGYSNPVSRKHDLEMVAAFRPARDREQAFELEVAAFAAKFNK